MPASGATGVSSYLPSAGSQRRSLATRARSARPHGHDGAAAQHQIGKLIEGSHRAGRQRAIDLAEFDLVGEDVRIEPDQAHPSAAVEIESCLLRRRNRALQVRMSGQDEIDIRGDRFVKLTKCVVFVRPVKTAVLLQLLDGEVRPSVHANPR